MLFWGPAHPRACGENWGVWADQAPAYGSSPRVRGKHDLHHLRCNLNGLIPARAGKTLAVTGTAQVGYGSSPRVRGKLRAS